MQQRVLGLLEYDKVLQMLSKECVALPSEEAALKLSPSSDIGSVRLLLNQTDEAQSYLGALAAHPVVAFSDAKVPLQKSRIAAQLSMRELLDIASLLRASRLLRSALTGIEPIGQGLLVSQTIYLEADDSLEKRIFACILSEEEMADTASPQLNDIRRSIRRENARVREKLNAIIQSGAYQKHLQENIITLRSGRYVVPVKQESRAQVPGLIHDQSASGATLFIEPMQVVEINNNIRQLLSAEKAEMDRVLMELTAAASPLSRSLEQSQDALIRLDIIFAKALLSRRLRGVAPVIIEDGPIELTGARHPLIHDSVVVPIDVTFEEGCTGLIVTGPNTGGKTVTLKTVGLLSLMAQTGMHISANYGAKLKVFDEVFADIGDEQSIEQSLSTFSSHISNIVTIVKGLTPKSLVLLDELGAGTDPAEGAALAKAILNTILDKRATVLATTHYSELKSFAMEREGLMNASMEFDVDTLRPTYRILMGIPGRSNAFEISNRLGLPDEIVDAARSYMKSERVDYEKLLESANAHLLKAQSEREAALAERAQAGVLLERAKAEEAAARDKREKALTKARDEAQKLLRDVQIESERVIKDLRKRADQHERRQLDLEIEAARTRLQDSASTIEAFVGERDGALLKPPENLLRGETVRLINHNLNGKVLSPPDAKGDVPVQAGMMKLTVHISNLVRVEEEAPAPQVAVTAGTRGVNLAPLQREVDVRGKSLEEAILEVDKYLDDVFLSGLNEVQIIHGKGTGVLRNGLSRHLRTHPHVAKYRLGNYGEGETGVTVVELK